MNNYQEALNKVNEIVCPLIGFNPEYHNNMAILQELVDKATSKKVIKAFGYKCPRCKKEYVGGLINYCDNCGQKLDWSEE